jgi:excisionase family DNA binding protein
MQQGSAPAKDEILTVQEVATYLEVSRSTVWRWCNTGRLPAFRIGREWRIHREALDRLTKPTEIFDVQAE